MQSQVIAQLVAQHVSETPSDTALLIKAVTEGLNAFANTQKDTSTKLHYYLMDLLNANDASTLKSGIYDIGEIVQHILPNWEGAVIHGKLKEKFAVQIAEYNRKMEEHETKKESVGDYAPHNPIAEHFGVRGE